MCLAVWDDPFFPLFSIELSLCLKQHLFVCFGISVEFWILEADIQIELLYAVCHAVGVLDGLHPLLFRDSVLFPEHLNQFRQGFIGQIELIFRTKLDALGVLQDGAALCLISV